MMKKLNDIVKANMCLGCGLCTLGVAKDKPVMMEYSDKRGHLVPSIKKASAENAEIGYRVCPGKVYKIHSLAKKYELGKYFNEDLGFYNDLSVVSTNDTKILSQASSSGVMTILLDYLIEHKMVDKAIVTKFDYTQNGPNAAAFATNKLEELIDAQGSKYCPVDFSVVLENIKGADKTYSYAFVGTPCQIASIRYIQDNIQDLCIKYFIGNFCGGFKSYNNLRRIIKLNRLNLNEVKYFRFRGGGQPGSLKVQTENEIITTPYPEYVKMTGYTKVKRCHFCVDATAELADFSCGDA